VKRSQTSEAAISSNNINTAGFGVIPEVQIGEGFPLNPRFPPVTFEFDRISENIDERKK